MEIRTLFKKRGDTKNISARIPQSVYDILTSDDESISEIVKSELTIRYAKHLVNKKLEEGLKDFPQATDDAGKNLMNLGEWLVDMQQTLLDVVTLSNELQTRAKDLLELAEQIDCSLCDPTDYLNKVKSNFEEVASKANEPKNEINEKPSIQDHTAETSKKTEVKLCPKCSSELIRRVTKKDIYAGKEFWACSAYPTCKFIEPI